MSALYDVAIIGGGVVGSAAARELSRYNLRICVLEREQDVVNGVSGRIQTVRQADRRQHQPGTAAA